MISERLDVERFDIKIPLFGPPSQLSARNAIEKNSTKILRNNDLLGQIASELGVPEHYSKVVVMTTPGYGSCHLLQGVVLISKSTNFKLSTRGRWRQTEFTMLIVYRSKSFVQWQSVGDFESDPQAQGHISSRFQAHRLQLF